VKRLDDEKPISLFFIDGIAAPIASTTPLHKVIEAPDGVSHITIGAVVSTPDGKVLAPLTFELARLAAFAEIGPQPTLQGDIAASAVEMAAITAHRPPARVR
jgi:hypothetical protein